MDWVLYKILFFESATYFASPELPEVVIKTETLLSIFL